MPLLVVSLSMAEPRPYVGAAFVCDRVLRETDGVQSAIRIVDKFTVTTKSDLPSDTEHGLQMTAFVNLKSGDVRGAHALRLRLCYPSGKTKDLPTLTEDYLGGEHGVSYTFQVVLGV